MKYTLNEINQVAEWFISQIGDRRVFSFDGPMGAGKTTLISAICERLKVLDTVNSPTFAIINEYEAPESPYGDVIYHFDCYRIDNIADAMNIGAEEYLYSGQLCFVEWSENIAAIMPTDTVNVKITPIDETTRDITIS